MKKFNPFQKVLIICFVCFVIVFCGFILGIQFQQDRTKKIVYVDFEHQEIIEPVLTEHKYKFLAPELSDYIVKLCNELEIDSDLAVAILMQENPEFNYEAMHRNENGTVDLGLWQLNDKYLYTTFCDNFWQFSVDLNAFEWKHNTFIALHQIEWLQSRLKVFDDVVMAYNCGIGAVMSCNIPNSTKTYLCRVKNNYNILKGEK